LERSKISLVFNPENGQIIRGMVVQPMDIPQKDGGILLDDIFQVIITAKDNGFYFEPYPKSHHIP